MARLKDRLARLEDRASSANAAPQRSEAERYEYWQARQRVRRREQTPPDASHASELIGLFRLQGSLPAMSATELIARILDWQPAPEGGRSRAVTEAVVYRAIYHGEEGLEHMALPEEWRAAFEAAEELGRRFLSMPPQEVAKWAVESAAMLERGEPKEAIEEHARSYEERHGITQERLTAALGPDADVLTDEECHWMIRAPLGDALTGSWGWAIAEHTRKLQESGGN